MEEARNCPWGEKTSKLVDGMEGARNFLWGEKTSKLVDSLQENNEAIECKLDAVYALVNRIFNNVSEPINFNRLEKLADRLDELHSLRQDVIRKIENKKSKLEGRWYCCPLGSRWAKTAVLVNGFFMVTSWVFATTANTIELFGDEDDVTLKSAKIITKISGDAFVGLTILFSINWASQELELKKLPLFVDRKDTIKTYALFLRNLKYLHELHEKSEAKEKIREISDQLKTMQGFLGRQMKQEEEKYISLVVYLAQDSCNFRPYLNALNELGPTSSTASSSVDVGEEDPFDRVYRKSAKKPKGTFEGGRRRILTRRERKSPWDKLDRYFGERRVNCLYNLKTHQKISRTAWPDYEG